MSDSEGHKLGAGVDLGKISPEQERPHYICIPSWVLGLIKSDPTSAVWPQALSESQFPHVLIELGKSASSLGWLEAQASRILPPLLFSRTPGLQPHLSKEVGTWGGGGSWV